MTFIIHFKDGHRETYNNRYDEDDEHEVSVMTDIMETMLYISTIMVGILVFLIILNV